MAEIGEAWRGASQCGKESEGKREVTWRGVEGRGVGELGGEG